MQTFLAPFIVSRTFVVGLCVGLGVLCSGAEAQSGFSNWREFANWCLSTGGNPLPNPPRCIPRQQIAPPEPSERKPPGPHLVWNEEDKKWQPESGYDWVDRSDNHDFRVMEIPPHVRWNEEDKVWQPNRGYKWVDPSVPGDFRVEWVPNQRSGNVVTTETEGSWRPEDGYSWVIDPPVPGDLRVKWVPNQRSRLHPNLVTAEAEGAWTPDSSDPKVLPSTEKLVGTYIFVACYKSGDPSEECSRNFYTATDALTTAMAEEAVGAASKELLTVHFPSVLDRAEQIKLLLDLEKKAIAFAQLKINADVKKLGVFSTREASFFEVQAEIARDAILLNKIHQQAVEQANSGMNWDHDWNASKHTFRSNAYDQAVQIHFGGSFP
jgi:hypothetical protein